MVNSQIKNNLIMSVAFTCCQMKVIYRIMKQGKLLYNMNVNAAYNLSLPSELCTQNIVESLFTNSVLFQL